MDKSMSSKKKSKYLASSESIIVEKSSQSRRKIRGNSRKTYKKKVGSKLTNRIKKMKYGNKIRDDKDCKKLNVYDCEFDKSYPLFIYVPGIGCSRYSRSEQESISDLYLSLLNTCFFSKLDEGSDVIITTIVPYGRKKFQEIIGKIDSIDKVNYRIKLKKGWTDNTRPDRDGPEMYFDIKWIKNINLLEEEGKKELFPSRNFLYVCDKTWTALKTIRGIYRSGCQNQILKSSSFLNDFILFLEKNLKKGHKIFLYGESFGGAICNTIAERIGRYNIENLFIRTFGSIYIYNNINRYDGKIIEGLNIKNYMLRGDVAWNRLSKKCKNVYKNIEPVDTEVETRTIMGRKKKLYDRWNDKITSDEKGVKKSTNTYHNRFAIFGTKDEWTLHSSYYTTVKKNIKEDMENFIGKLGKSVEEEEVKIDGLDL